MNAMEFADLNDKVQKFAKEVKNPKWILRCTTEERTKQMLIERFLDEILDYPMKFKFIEREYRVQKQGTKRVDYAILKNGDPIIFIEAKQRGTFLDEDHTIKQIVDYGEKVPSVEFVALTNGIEWRWFNKRRTKFNTNPFLAYDVFSPTDVELPFLNAIIRNNFDFDKAKNTAKNIHQCIPRRCKFVDLYGSDNLVEIPTKEGMELLERGQYWCAWVPKKKDGENRPNWELIYGARALTVEVIKFLAKQHRNGDVDFYERAELYLNQRIVKKRNAIKDQILGELSAGYVLQQDKRNDDKKGLLLYVEDLVIRKRGRSQSDELVDFWFPIGRTQ